MRAISTSIRGLALALLMAATALAAEPGERDIVDCNNNGINDALDVSGQTIMLGGEYGYFPEPGECAAWNSWGLRSDGVVHDVNVSIFANHTWNGDFSMWLYGPTGISAQLIDRPGHPVPYFGGFPDDGLQIWLDDEAPADASIEFAYGAGARLTGRYRPYPDALNIFYGILASGPWTLVVCEHGFLDTGSMGWSEVQITVTLPISDDCQGDLVPDECQLEDNDCNANGVPDECETDCNQDGIADECDIAEGTSTDVDSDGTPDECQPDCNGNTIPDVQDLDMGTSADCQMDGIPDECQIGTGPTTVIWDNGPPNDDETLAAVFGPQPADVTTVDDALLPAGAIVEEVSWLREEEDGFQWDSRVRLEIYSHNEHYVAPYMSFTNGGYGPDDSIDPIYALWVPDDAGAVTRTAIGAGTMATRYEYRVTGVNLELLPGTWWIGTHVSGTGHTGAGDDTYWVPSHTIAFDPILGDGAHVRTAAAETSHYVPLTALSGNAYDISFQLTGRLGIDCNGNAIPDDCDLEDNDLNRNGVPDDCEADCNGNGVPDDVDVNATDPVSEDCNGDATPDECQLAGNDCNGNGVPDECDWDCNDNGIPDDCDLSGGTSLDCQSDGIPDECQLLADADADSAATWFVQEPDLDSGAGGFSIDSRYGYMRAEEFTPTENDVARSVAWYGIYLYGSQPCPSQTNFSIVLYAHEDSCEPGDVLAVWEDVTAQGTVSPYVDGWSGATYQMYEFQAPLEPPYPVHAGQTYWLGIVAETGCQGEFIWWIHDSDDTDGLHALASRDVSLASYSGLDWRCGWRDLSLRVSRGAGDCDGNGLPDDCDLSGNDTNANGVPDECDPDCNGNGVPDDLDIAGGTSGDCTANGVPDECEPDCNSNTIADSCDIAGGTSPDCQPDGVPDECQLAGNDCDGNDVPDDCEISAGTSEDCNGNELPDECDLAGR
jgi:hypothetical protein